MRGVVSSGGLVTFRVPPSTSTSSEDGEDEKSSSEEEGESSDSAKRQPDLTWRWGIWQSRDARRAATSYTDQLLSHMPDSFRFQKEVLDARNIVLGARLLLALNAVAFFISYIVTACLLVIFHREGHCDEQCTRNHGCEVLYLLIEVNGGPWRVVADLLYLVIIVPVLIHCSCVEAKDSDLRRRLYLVALAIVYLKIWLMYMYPVGVACSHAERAMDCGGIGREDKVLDIIPRCRSFGFFLLNKDMGLVMISPVVVPECSKMRGFLWSFTVIYYAVAMIAIPMLVKTPDQRYHAYFDILIGLVFLILLNEAARRRKWSMERADQVSFVLALKQRKASRSMFQILTFMLPSFVVARILRSPEKTISEHVKRASILFIKINDFNSMIQRLSPSDLVEKLNSIFMRLDSYSSYRNVTKIETVAEEYMCAVGIVPSDQALEAESQGHETLIRLVQLACDVLDYSKSTSIGDQVVFQMGIHTGPLVAGVVGSKLPRFRLFGDTVNTAARMMQKGLPNEVQFGEETRRELPVGVAYRSRGPVEMKGKGVINTYLLNHDSSRVSRRRISFKSPRAGGRLQPPRGTVQLVAAMVQAKSGADSIWAALDDTEIFEDAVVNAGHSRGSEWSDCLDCGHSRPSRHNGAASHFCAWYYENHLFRKLVKRLDMHLIFILVLTFIETMYLADSLTPFEQKPQWHPVGIGKWTEEQCESLRFYEKQELYACKQLCWDYTTGHCTAIEFNEVSGDCTLRRCPPEDIPSMLLEDPATSCFSWNTTRRPDLDLKQEKQARRLSWFVINRTVAFAIILMWRAIVSCTNIVTTHARCLEWCTAVSCCILSCVLFLSYELMPAQFTDDKEEEIDRVIPQDFPISGLSRNITRLVAFPVYFMTVTAFPFRFVPCCIFLVGALFIALIESGLSPFLPYMLPTYGDILYFLSFNALRLFYSYQEERLLRQQYANGCAVESVMQRVQSILDTMMPAQVVKEISEHPDSPLPSHKYQTATIAQSDLVGFTEMSSQRAPEEVVAIIEEIFNMFDDLTDRYGVYKIETVGDAYVAGMAEPPLTERHSVVTMLRFALSMAEKTDAWSLRRGEEVRLRAGVHNGQCVGGVVGRDMQRYHLFGSLCSILDLVEGTSTPGCVQISSACFEALQQELGPAWNEKAVELLNCRIVSRTEDALKTSKGEIHCYSEVGGMTYFLVPLRSRYRTH